MDDDFPSVVGNLQRARKSWGWLLRILSREGADPNVSGIFSKAVIQVVVLFGEETLVLTPGWIEPLVVSNTGSHDGSPGGSQGDRGMVVGNTHHWSRKWWKQALRGSLNTSRGGRTRSRSIFRCNQFWASVRGPLGGRG